MYHVSVTPDTRLITSQEHFSNGGMNINSVLQPREYNNIEYITHLSLLLSRRVKHIDLLVTITIYHDSAIYHSST